MNKTLEQACLAEANQGRRSVISETRLTGSTQRQQQGSLSRKMHSARDAAGLGTTGEHLLYKSVELSKPTGGMYQTLLTILAAVSS